MPPPQINIVQAVDRQVTAVFEPHIVGDVNEVQDKVAKSSDRFDWDSHPNEDEGLMVLG